MLLAGEIPHPSVLKMAAGQRSQSVFCILLCIFCFGLRQSSCFRVINTYTGDLTAGETKRHLVWQNSDAILICALFSDLGDADVYVASDEGPRSGLGEYEYSSDSCGEDILVVLSSSKRQQLHIDVLGHLRHANTSYRLYVIMTEKEDMEPYSVTESWTREDGTTVKLVRTEFADPLAIRNDPVLVKVVDELRELDVYARPQGGNEGFSTFAETLITVAAKFIEIALEVLV